MYRPPMRRLSLSLAACMLVSPLACKRDRTGKTPSGAADAREHTNAPSDPFVIPALVPADALAVIAARSSRSFFSSVLSFDPLGHPDAAKLAALHEEIDGYLSQKVGMRLGDTNTAVFFATAKGTEVAAGAVLLGTSGQPQGEPFATIAGHAVVRVGDDVVAAKVGEAIVIGQPLAVRASLEGQGQGTSVLAKTIEDAGPGVSFAMAVDASNQHMASLDIPRGVDSLLATVDGSGVSVVLEGEPKTLEHLDTLVDQGLAMAVDQASREKERAMRRDEPAWVVASMMGLYWAKRMQAELTPRLEGSRLSIDVEVPMTDPALLVATLGIGAAIAVPAFIKYKRRSKTSEARVLLAKMFDSVAAYYLEEHIERPAIASGSREDQPASHRCPQMPGKIKGSTEVTPPLSVNCNDGPGGRCVPTQGPTDKPGHYDISLWTDNPVWDGLNFIQDEPHAFHYRFVYENSPGGFGACMFTAQAFGDLDNDGVFSTFERAGAADQNGVNGAAGLYIDNELE